MAGHDSKFTLARLDSLSSNQKELRKLLETNAGKEISSKITVAVIQYMKMMEELQYMEEKLPGLLEDLKTIQEKVDKRHKYCNMATVGGCATSIVGGAMFLGGVVASPFTFGASLGLTVAGTALGIGGSMATASAKGVDFIVGKYDLNKTNKMVDEFYEHYQKAQQAYEEITQICKELTAMLPALGNEGIGAALNAVVSAAGFAIDSARKPNMAVSAKSTALSTGFTAFSTGCKVFKICEAVVSPAKLHAATRLAIAPAKAASFTREFMVEVVNVARFYATSDPSGVKLAVVTSFHTAMTLLKTASGAFAVGGIIMDVWSLCSAGTELYKNTKCKVSQKISKRIEELENLDQGLKKLNQELATNMKLKF